MVRLIRADPMLMLNVSSNRQLMSNVDALVINY